MKKQSSDDDSSATQRARLSLRSERVRRLTAPQLRQVAGGAGQFCTRPQTGTTQTNVNDPDTPEEG